MLQNFFPIWCRRILLNQCPVTEKGNINSRSTKKVERRKLEKVFENPHVIKTPVVRNGKQSTLGYHPDIWKGWR